MLLLKIKPTNTNNLFDIIWVGDNGFSQHLLKNAYIYMETFRKPTIFTNPRYKGERGMVFWRIMMKDRTNA